MSISLLRDDQLWGLIACHHYSGPRVVPYTVRESSEFLGQALSWHIATRLHQHATERKFHVKEIEGELLRSMNGDAGLRDALAIPALLRLTDAHGAAVIVEGELSTIGATPEPALIRRLAEWMRPQMTDDVFVSDRLPSLWPMGAQDEAVASGVLAVALSRELGDFVIWFRPSAELVVDWAGEPRKQVTDEEGIPRLSPRGSFALWKEIIHGRSEPWHPWQLSAAADLRGAVLHLVQRRAAELLALNDQLVAADRAKDMFLAAVSHELRTPLQAILGWVTRLQEKGTDGPNGARALEIIAKNARIQSQLVDDLLDVARMVGGKLSIAANEVDLRQVVQNALDTVSLLVEQSGVALEVDLADEAMVFGDAQRLQQVLWNLLTNALKFTPREGRVAVRLSRDDEAIVLAVSDSGRGLAPESIARLFEAFWQVPDRGRRAQQGLGLGLAITRHIVDLHGGSIVVESAGLGKGATFLVRLPRLR
jgi:light-regulated signal transduction histidine kinase (bacteriophytochrome)